MAAVRRKDYSKTLQTARRLITKFGRTVTFVKLSAGPTDPTKPWRGATDPRAIDPVSSLEIDAVFVEPESLERLGLQRASADFIKSAEQVMIVATDQDLGKFDEVIDTDGGRFKCDNIQTLQPAGTIILHYVRVQRRGKATAVRGALL